MGMSGVSRLSKILSLELRGLKHKYVCVRARACVCMNLKSTYVLVCMCVYTYVCMYDMYISHILCIQFIRVCIHIHVFMLVKYPSIHIFFLNPVLNSAC